MSRFADDDLAGTRTLPGVVRHVCSLRVRVEIMGPGKYEHVGKSQSDVMMIDPMISARTRISRRARAGVPRGAQRLRVPQQRHDRVAEPQ
jgi:hypothetical protein